MLSLTIKLAFMYEDMRRLDSKLHIGLYPTYRVSLIVYPEVKLPHITMALSEVSLTNVKPKVLVNLTDKQRD
jgi:hypothetical protein